MALRQLKKEVLVGYRDIRIPSALKDKLVERALTEGMSDMQYVNMLLQDGIENLEFIRKAWKKLSL